MKGITKLLRGALVNGHRESLQQDSLYIFIVVFLHHDMLANPQCFDGMCTVSLALKCWSGDIPKYVLAL